MRDGDPILAIAFRDMTGGIGSESQIALSIEFSNRRRVSDIVSASIGSA
jgi:hypothetical protein